MASNCFTPIRGRRMRVTRIDSVGRPSPGLCSTVVTSGFVSVAMTAEIEEGEETTVRTAGGELCVSERGADQLKWINVVTEFCNVDPDLFSMINPTWTKLLDRNGNTIGWEESHSYSAEAGFGLEVWSDVTGYTPTEPTAEGAWVYYLLPWISGGTLGDLTVENGAVSFTISGRTRKGSQWGKGPYNIMANPPDGTCGPLITAFNPESPRRIFLTTCRPPEPVCGCQPLSASTGPDVVVFEVTTDATRFTVRAVASGAGPFTVDWGDGTGGSLPAGLTGTTHTYGTAGTYVVAVHPTADPTQITYTTVTIPYSGTTPPAPLLTSLSEDTSDATRRTAALAWDNGTAGLVTVDWGDGTAALSGQAATGTATHAYTNPGTYSVSVTDETDGSRRRVEEITIPFGPTFTVTEVTTDTNRRTVRVVVNNYGKGQVKINWGQAGSPIVTNPGDNVTSSTFTYTTNGTYNITVTDSDDSSRSAVKAVTVPFDTLILSVVEANPPGSPRRKVTATWHNGVSGAVSVDWGEGSPVAGAQSGTLDHTYAANGTYTITVTDATDALRVVTAEVTVPFV